MTPADRTIADALAAAVRRHGRDWCGDPRRCAGMLKDLLPGRQRDVTLLVHAVEAGVVRELAADESVLPVTVRVEQCVRRLHDDVGVRHDVARRVVRLWAAALGIELPPDATTGAEVAPASRPPAAAGPVGKASPPGSVIGRRTVARAVGAAVALAALAAIGFVLRGGGARRGEVVENSIGMRMVVIPAGRFEMGSNDDQDGKPAHPVRIARPFLLGQTEVTQGRFEHVMGTTPWRGREYVTEGPDVAASYVSWDDAAEFCRRLTDIERRAGRLAANLRYRLPTEAEWEYACRAGTTTRFSFGDDEARLGEHAWWGGLYGGGNAANARHAHETGRRLANPWNLFDMHGNVCEWCADWYGKDYYANSPDADPPGPAAGSFRVVRGGGWDNFPAFCRSAYRGNGTASRRYESIGFRVVCEME